jgi:hypothetical protein
MVCDDIRSSSSPGSLLETVAFAMVSLPLIEGAREPEVTISSNEMMSATR